VLTLLLEGQSIDASAMSLENSTGTGAMIVVSLRVFELCLLVCLRIFHVGLVEKLVCSSHSFHAQFACPQVKEGIF
jgi:hypothetical protein